MRHSRQAPLCRSGPAGHGGRRQITVASTNGTAFRVNTAARPPLPTSASACGRGLARTDRSNSNVSVLDANGATRHAAITFGSWRTAATTRPHHLGQRPNGALQTQDHHPAERCHQPRNGRSIDYAISYINPQLQQSNDPTLQKIVAVKEDVARATRRSTSSARFPISASA